MRSRPDYSQAGDYVDAGEARRAQVALARRIRLCTVHNVLGVGPVCENSKAIYALVDPRDITVARYIGQTAQPSRRLVQHLTAARLWLPADRPWWIRQERLRPLYTWIRELYADAERLPVMVVLSWIDSGVARIEERRHVSRRMVQQPPLLNVEAGVLREQAVRAVQRAEARELKAALRQVPKAAKKK